MSARRSSDAFDIPGTEWLSVDLDAAWNNGRMSEDGVRFSDDDVPAPKTVLPVIVRELTREGVVEQVSNVGQDPG